MKVIWFKINSRFANFRKYYTTTSSMSYIIPPLTTIKWLIAAILWKERDTYYEEYKNLKLTLKLVYNIKKKYISINYYNKPENIKKWDIHTQIILELLINPTYIIFVFDDWFKDFDKLKYNLENKEYYYTPYLGIAPFIANIEYLGVSEVEEKNSDEVYIDSIIPYSFVDNIKLEEWKNYFFEEVPVDFNSDRTLYSKMTYIFNSNWDPILLKNIKYYSVILDKTYNLVL